MMTENNQRIHEGLDAIAEQLRRVNAALEALLESLEQKPDFLQGRAEERYYETGKWPGETK